MSLEKLGIDQNQEEIKTSTHQKINFLSLFRFAQKKDIIYMIAGSLCSVLVGGALPIYSYLWGNMTAAFRNPDETVKQAYEIFIQYIAFGFIAIFLGWGMQYFWQEAAENQTNRCKKAFVISLLNQQVGWLETQNSATIISKFIADSEAFQLGIGDKISLFIYLISMFISGTIISLIMGWKMTLVVLSFLPPLAFIFAFTQKYRNGRSNYEMQTFQSSSGIAQQTIQSIKVVKQFNAQKHQQKRFKSKINLASQKIFSYTIKQVFFNSFSVTFLIFLFLLSFWFGSECVQGTANCQQKKNTYTGGTLITIFFGIVIPAIHLNQLLPSLFYILQAKTAATNLFAVIDRQPLIQSQSNSIRLANSKGLFKFHGVSFGYPKDKSRKVLDNLNMQINSRSTGIMGESGCGKSTLLQLMMRLYDPDEGKITLDGVDLRQLDLQWLRRQIGYVGQEPLLFSTSIRENLLVGKHDASYQEMIKALRQAEILEFVMSLKDTVDTYVGIGGSQLSGGQKQRIAIARALIKNPKILLFDEATSALDRKNEFLILKAKRKIMMQKTSITIAHNFETIAGSDQIFKICKGKAFNEAFIEHNIDQLQSQATNETISNEFLLQCEQYLSKNDINEQKINLYQKLIQQAEDNTNKVPLKLSHEAAKQLLNYAFQKKFSIIIGAISSIITGLIFPLLGLFISKIIGYNLMYEIDPKKYHNQINLYCLKILLLCLIAPFTIFIQGLSFRKISNSIIDKLRQRYYAKILRLPLSWYENKQNNAEQTSIQLGADMFIIDDIAAKYFQNIWSTSTNIIFGILMAFFYQWRTALLCLLLQPLVVFSSNIQSQIISGYLGETQKLQQQSYKILIEAITNFKSILSYCYQQQIYKKYQKILYQIKNKKFYKKIISCFLYGISFFILFFVNGLIFYLAAVFTRDYKIQPINALSAVFLTLFGGIAAGNTAKYLPDLEILKSKAAKIYNLLNQQDQQILQLKRGSKLIDREIDGDIVFKNVTFKYKNRPQIVLHNLNIEIKKGQQIALIGQSGCGKSTIINLLLGFYQCQSGQIIIDGYNINDYSIKCLRQNFGMISQQPTLFDDSVIYNILYNKQSQNSQEIYTVAAACRIPTIHSHDKKFFNQKVGPRGSHISGGQKQRVAIARTFLRKPKVFLLDQVTSALDENNSKKIQNSLNNIIQDKTSITITHKLNTLTQKFKIFILKNGRIIQSGTYLQLISKGSNFYNLSNIYSHQYK